MMMFSARSWGTILAFTTVFIPQSGAAYDPPDCMVSKNGLAFFHDDTIQVLRPVKATSSEYIWEQTADSGKTIERIGSFEVSDTTLFDPGSLFLPLATLTPTILVSSFSIYSLGADGVKSLPIFADDSVIDAARKLELNPGRISECCNKPEEYTQAGGYEFKFEDQMDLDGEEWRDVVLE